LANLPVRIAAGAFIVNSGLAKLAAEKEHAEGVHAMAKGTYPFLESLEPVQFTKLLGVTETVLGAALVLPVVGDGLAGLALTGFSGGLLGLYARTPGMRQEGSIRPSQQGTALAKDVWLFGIGLSLVADSMRTRRLRHRAAKAKEA
jgi:uncharacterized membrane protein YkgB